MTKLNRSRPYSWPQVIFSASNELLLFFLLARGHLWATWKGSGDHLLWSECSIISKSHLMLCAASPMAPQLWGLTQPADELFTQCTPPLDTAHACGWRTQWWRRAFQRPSWCLVGLLGPVEMFASIKCPPPPPPPLSHPLSEHIHT